jgi:hypothetical protein
MAKRLANVLSNTATITGERSAESIGRDVLGPIFAEYAQRLWLFQFSLPERDDACLLFCARGGLRLRVIYERFLAATGLQAPLPYDDIMISRLVAARTSIASPGPALVEELSREFDGQTMREVAVALTQEPVAELGSAWDQPFDPKMFVALLQEDAPGVARMHATTSRLNAAFARHVEAVSHGCPRIILSDTGLYGSTLRLLRAGMPDKQWMSAQFARSNYKGFATPHFDGTVGISVERDGYMAWNARTTVLRFWQLIESALEPDLESVRTFNGASIPLANLQVPGWQDRISSNVPGLFTGILSYIDDLSSKDLPHVGMRAEEGWWQLRRLVIWPRRADVSLLSLPPRSRDFGRTEAVHQFPGTKPIRSSLWREGAIIQRYPKLGRGFLMLLEAAHTLRTLRKMYRKKYRKAACE